MKIMPTHTCFDDAVELLTDLLKATPALIDTDEFLLVHGICDVASIGGRFAHAWIESDHGNGAAFFFGLINGERVMLTQRVQDFYKRLNVVETAKYTPLQVWEENAKSGHYGPWVDRYLALCAVKGEQHEVGETGRSSR